MQTTELYRHFGQNGKLLYIGISLSTVQRLQQHRAKAPWFEQITEIKVQRFANRASALRAERLAIQRERPAYNIVWAVAASDDLRWDL